MLISSKYYIHFRQTNKMQSQYNQLISTNTSDQTTLIRDASPKSKSYKKYWNGLNIWKLENSSY